LKPESDSDNGDAENYLKIKKKKVANLMDEQIESPLNIKRGELMQKKEKKILIAESSDSVGTDDSGSS
jgi:hypothetical protein